MNPLTAITHIMPLSARRGVAAVPAVLPAGLGHLRSFVDRSGLASPIDLLPAARERRGNEPCCATGVRNLRTVSRSFGGLRYGSGMAHPLGSDLRR